MSIRDIIKRVLPDVIVQSIRRMYSIFSQPSQARKESNQWLRKHCKDIQGKVLSIGSAKDKDGEGDYYKNYFSKALCYTTSEISENFNCDLVLDIRAMPEIANETYDCIYCSGVLEHVDDFHAGFNEITRILKPDGILLLGLPFRQPIHMPPQDFWRFTKYGIKYLLEDSYEIIAMTAIDDKNGTNFPATYWVKARKKVSFE